AAKPIKALATPSGAKRLPNVGDWCLKLRSAFRIAAVVAYFGIELGHTLSNLSVLWICLCSLTRGGPRWIVPGQEAATHGIASSLRCGLAVKAGARAKIFSNSSTSNLSKDRGRPHELGSGADRKNRRGFAANRPR